MSIKDKFYQKMSITVQVYDIELFYQYCWNVIAFLTNLILDIIFCFKIMEHFSFNPNLGEGEGNFTLQLVFP